MINIVPETLVNEEIKIMFCKKKKNNVLENGEFT